MNDFYNASGYPATRAAGSSLNMRTELANIALGFDKLPSLTGNANRLLQINAGGTAIVANAAATLTAAGALSGITDLTTTGNTILGNAVGDTLNVANGSLRVDSAGAIGIGAAPLGGGAKVWIQPGAGSGIGIYQDADGKGLISGYTNTGTGLGLRLAGSGGLYLSGNGSNVNHVTVALSGAVSVAAPSSGHTLTLTHTAGSGTGAINTTDGTVIGILKTVAANSLNLHVVSGHSLVLGTSDTEYARLNASGWFSVGRTPVRVGIDAYQASGNVYVNVESGSAGSVAASFRASTTSRAWQLGVSPGLGTSSFSIYDETAAAVRMEINTAGVANFTRTGSGTTAFFTSGGTDTSVALVNTARTGYIGSDSGQSYLLNTDAMPWTFYTNSAPRLVITSTGVIDAAQTFRAQGNTSATSGVGLEVVYNAGAGYLIGYDRTGATYKPVHVDGSTIYLGVNGSATSFILNGTGLGLNTSPNWAFDAQFSLAAVNGLRAYNSNASSSGHSQVRIESQAGSAYTYYILTGVYDWYSGIDRADNLYKIGVSATMGSNAVLLVNGGTGLGVFTTPAARLHLASTTDTDGIRLDYRTAPTGSNGQGIDFFHWNNSAADVRLARIRSVCDSGAVGSEGGYMGLWTKPSGSSLTERLRISSAGLVDVLAGSGSLRVGGHVTRFESAEQTCPTTNLTAVNLTHGGSRAPDQVRIFLRCKTAELGYSVGDEYCVTDMDPGLNDRFFGHWANATTVNYWWVMGTNNAPAIRQKNTSTLTTVTAANWRVVVRALWL